MSLSFGITVFNLTMNNQPSSHSESEQSSLRQSHNSDSLLQKLSIKSLRSAQSILDQETLQSLNKKYQLLLQGDHSPLQFIQCMIYSLFNYIDRLQQSIEVDVVKQDYTVLEEAVQKSQAQIRKHIRIQQQLKIYLDTLEQKGEQLEKKLAIEQMKYAQLFESVKEMDEERKELLKKVARLEQGKMIRMEESRDKSKGNSNYTTINEQIYKDYFGGRKVKVNKGRHVIDKINQKSRKLSSNQKSGSNLHFVEGSIQINLSNNIVVSKKGSYDQHLTKKQANSHNSSIRQLTKTVNMKHPTLHGIERRPNRKISKHKTQAGQHIDKKEHRSNSVLN